MELKRYFRIVMKRIWIVILLLLIAGGAEAYYSYYVLVPVYQAGTTLYVMNQDPGQNQNYNIINDLVAGTYLVKDYSELAKSRAVTEKVIEELKLKNISPSGLASQISVVSKNDTRIIEIDVLNTNPMMAKQIADKVSEVFVQKSKDLLKVDTVNIIDLAQIPWGPVSPQPIRNISLAALLGLIAGIGIIFLIEYLNDSIRRTEDVEKYLGLNVLGIIPVFSIK